jgi:putative transposase
MHKTNYPTNLTEKQWQVIEKIVNSKKRKRKHSLREILDAIFYLLKTGCQLRMLPNNFAPKNTVYFYYSKWKNEGLIEELNEMLRNYIRKKAGKHVSPSVGIIDSRSVKTTRLGVHDRGIDGGKKVKGRKQHIIVDTLSLLLTVVVHAANIHNSQSAFRIIEQLKYRLIIADGGYRSELAEKIRKVFGWTVEVVLRSDSKKGFEILPKKWIVKRTFA